MTPDTDSHSGGDRLSVGTYVVDRDATDDPDHAVVVRLPDAVCAAWEIEDTDGPNSVSLISDSSRFHSSSTAQPGNFPASIETDGESTIDPGDEEGPESGPEGDSDQSTWVADWVRRWFT
jgi:hypothetical protein